MTGTPLVLASASDIGTPLELSSVRNMLEKSMRPSSSPNGGMITPSTRVVTILPNAAPMITPTARSTTLPRAMKLRNSFNMHPVLSDTSGFRFDGVERVVPEDVERAAIGSAEDQLYG